MLGFAVVIASPMLVYAQPATSPATTKPVAQPPPELPVYNAGVDKSIRDYLCAPSEEADGLDLVRCINRLYKFGITAGALLLVFFIIYSGYLYMAGGQSGKEKAKGIIPNTLTGMAILLGSYVLLYFINPSLVAFKPIQPPIFSAEDLPSCEEVGFNNNCLISVNEAETTDGDAANATPTTGKGYASCKGGVVSISAIPRAGSASRICQELLTKMQSLVDRFKSDAPGYYFAISSTIRNGKAESRCHYSGNDVSGNCADTVLRTTAGARVPGNNEAWGKLCRLLLGAGLSLANETGTAHSGCRPPKTYKNTNGAHFHVYVPGDK